MATQPKGIFSARMIAELFETGALRSAGPLDADQIQPASLDLRLGQTAYRVRSSFLPGPGCRRCHRAYPS